MAKRELLHEWMHRFEVNGPIRDDARHWPWEREFWRARHEELVVRVWAAHPREPDGTYYQWKVDRQRIDIQAAITHWTHCTYRQVPELLELIAALKFTNAVEVLDKSGNGRLVYVDWP